MWDRGVVAVELVNPVAADGGGGPEPLPAVVWAE